MTRKLLDNGNVEITTVKEVKRYSGVAYKPDQWFYDDEMDNILGPDRKNDSDCKYCKIWTPIRDFSNLCTEKDFEPIGDSLQDDKKLFQRYLDREYGKGQYKAYVLGAYIHSGVSFSVSDEGDHRCKWDSSQLGFIGLPTKEAEECWLNDPNKVARELTALWEGEYTIYEIKDELTEDYIESLTTYDYKQYLEFREKCKKEYDVDFDKVEIAW